MPTSDGWSKTWTFFEGDWHEGNVPIMGVRTHAAWLGSMVFDGARAFEGVAPDLDLHCARVNASAQDHASSKPMVPTETWIGLVARGDASASTATRRSTSGRCTGPSRARPLADARRIRRRRAGASRSTRRRCRSRPAFAHHAVAVPPADARIRAGRRQGRLPLSEQRARADRGARARLRQLSSMCDMLGNVAELATANIFMAKDGVVFTPAPNGTFLAGITRQRVIALLREAGVTRGRDHLRYPDFETADEIFSTGNYSKVSPVTRIGERSLQPGPLYRKARELYWEFAHGESVRPMARGPAGSAGSRTTVRGCRRRAHRPRRRARSRPAPAHRAWRSRTRRASWRSRRPAGPRWSRNRARARPAASDAGRRPRSSSGGRRACSRAVRRAWRSSACDACLNDEPPVVEHVAVVRARDAAGEPVEVRVLVGVQPRHVEHRQGDAGRQHCERRAAAQAAEPRRGAASIQAPARPPSTASGGSTNTKCRMPLYIAGRSATVTASGSNGGERDQRAGPRAGSPRRRAATPRSSAPRAPPKPSARKISGSFSANSVGT